MVDIEKIEQITFEEKFELFWNEYPKKVGKKPCYKKFKLIKDFKNVFLGLNEYNKKWLSEDTPKKYIPNPLTFLNQERYYDEVIIEESKKHKYKKIIEENKQTEKEWQEVNKTKQEIYIFYTNLTNIEQTKIKNKIENEIKIQNPKLIKGSPFRETFFKAKMRVEVKKIMRLKNII